MMKIPVLEIFGPTIQGEGAVIGRKTMFVRTAGCDFSCVWCDSKFTWDGTMKEEIEMLLPETIYERLQSIAPNQFNHVTISGGNPALIKNLSGFVSLLHDKDIEVALETQGTKFQSWMTEIDQLTISPKPPSSTMTHDLDQLDTVIRELDPDKVTLKVVIFNDEDYHFSKMIHKCYPHIKMYLQVGNPYLDDTVEDHTSRLLSHYESLIDKVMPDSEMNNVYVTPQLHTLLWSNKKGV
ncbi:7-carboxy-7-deazaguanine synthase QueE [Macrococcus armenti]|uniref:7-carboxy-7-deazaguanine synthase QueE n=1 Tax=Macrococcus armenti TaxID=2875764 RepID=UPI001CC99C21|nr:7-carboxy-7-deazaguanine synthase QueE [Macrococcus armenti]UBH09695.1 7-carboxy-7-deazaguanine synthase QueE [Macrococcus armenti]UBH11991.1 7-carboxy-7-deazaguanine synthase QueE [Macrococcus armenti]UBH16492.1 7-carboxy-7-deazaguanine synthase QueE [Macrococcus armenti]UBH18847.1 7-carboxy-7-deazaguanine synthase QueE [Macrococcus armenti]UBH21126.1 7-carboxy-7-deazaguanine synthase QueE [Macrococcus armenti]